MNSINEVMFVYVNKKISSFAKYIEKDGEIVEPLMANDSAFLLILEKILAKKNLKIARKYNKKVIDFEGIIIIFDANATYDKLLYLSNYSKAKKKILLIWNPIESIKMDVEDIKKLGFDVWSYSEEQCNKYLVKQIDYFYCESMYTEALKDNKIEYDVIFVGKDKNRKRYIQNLRSKKYFCDLNWNLYLTATHFWEILFHPFYKKSVSYSKVQVMQNKSKAILEIVPSDTVDITMRTVDSIILKKKLITNSTKIISKEYYDPNNVFIIGKDNEETIFDFLNSGYNDVSLEMIKQHKLSVWKEKLLNDKPLNRDYLNQMQ